MTSALIAGCGYLGRALGREMSARGWRVYGLCRSEASLDQVRAAGLTPFAADLNNPQTLLNLPAADAVVACQAPPRGESYEKIYFEAIDHLIRALRPAASFRFVFVSSSAVYGSRAGGWVDADTPIDPARLDDNAKILRKTEERVLAAPLRGMVVRLSGIYGPGRSRADSIRSGRVKPAGGPAFTNRIHRDDAVSAVCTVLAKGEPGQIYLASDDQPTTQDEFYGWLCPRLGLPKPAEPSADAASKAFAESKRCANAKLKRLGWIPKYPGYQEGYGELLA